MADKIQQTICIKWVRSTIGFSQRQKEILRSLGFRRLNHVVKRPDTPQIRGLIAKVPHLVEIVEAQGSPQWTSVPEYTILLPVPESAREEQSRAAVGAESERVEAIRAGAQLSSEAAATRTEEEGISGPSEIVEVGTLADSSPATQQGGKAIEVRRGEAPGTGDTETTKESSK